MSIDAKITGKIDNNNVQVQISTARAENKRFYAVPENKADTFIKNYKKVDKRNSIVANGGLFAGIFAGILAANAVTRTLKSTALKWILNMTAGIIGAGLSIVGSSKYMSNQYNKLLQAHNAKEITY